MKIVPLIFAAGKGTRLRPITYKTPKPLVCIKNDLSMLDLNLARLIETGFSEVFVTISYKKNLFERLVQKYKNRIEIVLLEEKSNASGHIAPIRDNIVLLDGYDVLLGINGDTYVDFEMKNLLEASQKDTMLIVGSRQLTSIPNQLLCKNNNLIGINTNPPYFYNSLKDTFEARNNIGLYLIPVNFIKLANDTNGELGMFGEGDLVDIVVKNAKKVECINLPIFDFWSFNTTEDLEYVRKNYS